MKQDFTDYVRDLERTAGVPDREALENVLLALRRALTVELRKRGLWESSPRYLGVLGWNQWNEGAVQGEGALQELVVDCYSFIFIQRLAGLRAQLEVKPNIEGVVFRSIRNFLHDRQSKQDPLGYRIFQILRKAGREAVEEGLLRISSGSTKVKNETVLGFREAAAAKVSTAEELETVVAGWADQLLPDMITARGKAQGNVVACIKRLFGELPGQGVESFRFKDLIGLVKNDIRSRWAALRFQEKDAATSFGDRDLLEIVWAVEPDSRLIDWDSFRGLVVCVEEQLQRFPEDDKKKGYLFTLWRFLRTYAVGAERPETSVSPTDAETLPSRRRLAKLLGIPRERFKDLYQALGRLVRHCRGLDRPPAAKQGNSQVINSRGKVSSESEPSGRRS